MVIINDKGLINFNPLFIQGHECIGKTQYNH